MVKVSLASVNEPKPVCPICMDVSKDHARVVACGHVFDFHCIKSWILACDKEYRAKVCPCCRIKMKAIGRVDSKGYRFTTPVASLIRETDDMETREDPASERMESVVAEERNQVEYEEYQGAMRAFREAADEWLDSVIAEELNRMEYEEYQSSMRAAREAAEQQYIMDEQRRQCLEEREELSWWTPRCTIS
jgi:hypothetical protein